MAWHERLYGRYQKSLNLEHYLTALSRKPGALAGSSPLKQWRRDGRWPKCFDELWEVLKSWQGESAGTRAMIGLLQLGAAQGWDCLRAAVEQALELGSRASFDGGSGERSATTRGHRSGGPDAGL